MTTVTLSLSDVHADAVSRAIGREVMLGDVMPGPGETQASAALGEFCITALAATAPLTPASSQPHTMPVPPKR